MGKKTEFNPEDFEYRLDNIVSGYKLNKFDYGTMIKILEDKITDLKLKAGVIREISGGGN